MKPNRIIKLRTKLGMTQEEFAKHVGIRRATVTNWEAGKVKPSPMAVKLLQLLEKDNKT